MRRWLRRLRRRLAAAETAATAMAPMIATGNGTAGSSPDEGVADTSDVATGTGSGRYGPTSTTGPLPIPLPTTTAPVMPGCSRHAYAYVPDSVKRYCHVSPAL